MNNNSNKPLSLLAMAIALSFGPGLAAEEPAQPQTKVQTSEVQQASFYEDDDDFNATSDEQSQGWGWQTKQDKKGSPVVSSQNSNSSEDTSTGGDGGGDTSGGGGGEDSGTYSDTEIKNHLRYVVKGPGQSYEFDHHTGRIIYKNGASTTTIQTSTGQGYGLASDASIQNLYWTSAKDENVKKFNLASGELTELVSSFDDPYATLAEHNGYVYVYLFIQNKLLRYVHFDPNNPSSVDADSVDAQLIKDFGGAAVHGLSYDRQRNMILINDSSGRPSFEVSPSNNIVKFLRYSPAS